MHAKLLAAKPYILAHEAADLLVSRTALILLAAPAHLTLLSKPTELRSTGALQVYSTDLVTAVATSSEKLARRIRDTLGDPQNPTLPTPHLAPHSWVQVLFILLQSPLNHEHTGIGRALLGNIAAAIASISQEDKQVTGSSSASCCK